MHTRRTIPRLAGAASSSNGLVVPKPFDLFVALSITAKPKRQVIAITLTGCASLECLENDVCDALRSKDIATNYGCLV
jgi:hypothetical protein